MSDIKELVKRLRRGKLAYTTTYGNVYERATPTDLEAADALEALERERDEARAEVARLREIVADIPAALNSHFSAGIEERENGSARRQARLMERGEELIRRASAALSAETVEDRTDG